MQVIFELEPGREEQIGVSASDLAVVTARHCFQEADLNNDGRLSLEEFKTWCNSSTGTSSIQRGVVEAATHPPVQVRGAAAAAGGGDGGAGGAKS